MFRPIFLCAFVLASVSRAAHPALDETGVKGGLVVAIGGTADLVAELRPNDSYIVQGLRTDPRKVAAARVELQQKGVYGDVSVERFNGKSLPYIENFVNLLVAEDLGEVTRGEVMRVLVPEGKAYVKQDGEWQTWTKPRPDTIDEWTHFFHNPSGNAVAQDEEVAPPERLQWVGGPKWSRHHDRMASMSALVSGGGRMFYIMDEGSRVSIQLPSVWKLVARDAFNGTPLWKRDIPEWHSQLWPLKSGPSQLARRLVVDGDEVFATLSLNGPVSKIDAADGTTLHDYAGSEGAEEILVEGGDVFALVRKGKSELAEYAPAFNTGDQKRVRTEFVWQSEPRQIRAYDAETGAQKWMHEGKVAPITISVAGDSVVFHDGETVVCLGRATGEQRWKTDEASRRKLIAFNFAPRVVIYEDVVLYAGGDGKMASYDLKSGETLWESKHDRSGYESLQDLLVVAGLVWSSPLTSGGDSGVMTGRDPRTGEIKKQFPPNVETYWFHHRCYISKATERFIMPSRTGIEFVDHDKEHWDINHWVRGGCLYGVMPANGLTYAPPHNCACYPEAKLYGFNALAAKSETFTVPTEIDEAARLEKGPAFGAEIAGEVTDGDWPTYRRNNARSGSSKSGLEGELDQAWKAELGGKLSAMSVVGDRVFVAQIDQHTLHALNAGDGSKVWSFTAGGRIDSPPTYDGGRLVFGSADGSVYCLRASDGELCWRFRAAPVDRRLMSFEGIESVWPVHGSVLVEKGVASFVAGRSTFLDGGLRYFQVDVKTGKKLMERIMDHKDPETGEDIQNRLQTLQMQVGLPDILSSDGKHTYLRSQKIDKATGERLEIGPISGNPAEQGAAQQGEGAHLFAPMGYLDDTYFHRAYWVYGKNFAGGHGGYFQAGKYAPSGRMLVFNDEKVYGFGRDPQYLKWTTTIEHQLFAANREAPDAPKPAARKRGGRVPASTALVNFPKRDTMDPAGTALTVELWAFPDGPGGVILAHGGPANGYALTLQKNKPRFLVRSDEALKWIAADIELKKGWNHLVGVLGEDKSMTLYVNGAVAAKGEATGLLGSNPVQPLDLGSDSLTAVGQYKPTFRFTGLIDELRISRRALSADEVAANFKSPEKAREKNGEALLAVSFDEPTGRDESGKGNHGTVREVAVGKGKLGNAIWFRKGKGKAPAPAAKGKPAPASYVQRDWNERVPLFAQSMALAGDTLLVAGPPDIMDEEYTFERLMAKDEAINETLEEQKAALEGAVGGRLMAVNVENGARRQELKLDALPVWDGLSVARGSLFVADKNGVVTRFGKGGAK